MSMGEEFGSIWTYRLEEEENIQELKQKLLRITFEFESFKLEANEEILRTDEHTRTLMSLLKTTCRERDEAKYELQKAQQKLAATSTPTALPHALPQLLPESPLLLKANSSVTKSSSFSDQPYNPHSYGSSPVDSFLDTTTSPDFSNFNVVDSNTVCFVNQPLVKPDNGFVSTSLVSSVKTNTGPADDVMEKLSIGKPLPLKGKLLQAVVEAGITLQTLLLAGPLPRWRNPPPVQSFKIPPINIKTSDTPSVNQNPVSNRSSSSFLESFNINFQPGQASTLKFSNSSSSNCFLSAANSGVTLRDQILASKRQRLH